MAQDPKVGPNQTPLILQRIDRTIYDPLERCNARASERSVPQPPLRPMEVEDLQLLAQPDAADAQLASRGRHVPAVLLERPRHHPLLELAGAQLQAPRPR